MTTCLAPFPRFKAFDQNAGFLAGGKLWSYVAGSTTPQDTFTDQSGTTPNENPVILDGSGEADIWLATGAYKFVLTDANDVPQWTVDNIEGQASDIVANSLTVNSIAISGQLVSTASGVAPFVVGSVVRVTNLNADLLDGNDWANPAPIGATAPSTGVFTDIEGPIGTTTPATGDFSDLTTQTIAVGPGPGTTLKQIKSFMLTGLTTGSIGATSHASGDLVPIPDPGVQAGDVAIITPVVEGANLIVTGCIAQAGKFRVTLYNPTGGGIDPVAVTWNVLWIDIT